MFPGDIANSGDFLLLHMHLKLYINMHVDMSTFFMRVSIT